MRAQYALRRATEWSEWNDSERASCSADFAIERQRGGSGRVVAGEVSQLRRRTRRPVLRRVRAAGAAAPSDGTRAAGRRGLGVLRMGRQVRGDGSPAARETRG